MLNRVLKKNKEKYYQKKKVETPKNNASCERDQLMQNNFKFYICDKLQQNKNTNKFLHPFRMDEYYVDQL